MEKQQTKNKDFSAFVFAIRQPAEKQSRVSPQAPGSRRFAREDGSRGFTLLLAALAASIALTLGSSIFSISSKQIQLSSIGRDSQFAFYAADTAAECALYWDVRFSYFATSTPPDPQSQYVCDGQALNATGRPSAGNPAPYPYTMSVQIQPNGHCANITVLKCDGPISSLGACTHGPAPAPIRTIVHADGFNTTCANITSATALERSVELTY